MSRNSTVCSVHCEMFREESCHTVRNRKVVAVRFGAVLTARYSKLRYNVARLMCYEYDVIR